MSYNCGWGEQGHGPCESLGTITCRISVVGVNKGMVNEKYFRFYSVSFLCQLNFMDIITLSQS